MCVLRVSPRVCSMSLLLSVVVLSWLPSSSGIGCGMELTEGRVGGEGNMVWPGEVTRIVSQQAHCGNKASSAVCPGLFSGNGDENTDSSVRHQLRYKDIHFLLCLVFSIEY